AHGRQQLGATARAGGELPPAEDAPAGRDHRGALPQAVRDRTTCRARGDQVERHADAPDTSAEAAGEMRAEVSLEITRTAHGSADEWLLHRQRIPHEIAEEYPDREHEHGRIGAHLARV